MKRLRKLIGLIAICGMSAFLTGCDDDDDDVVVTGTVSPASLNGRSYTLTDAGTGGSISFAADANTYALIQSGVPENGTFTAVRSGNSWDVTIVNAAGTTTSSLQLTFSSASAGTYSFQRPGADRVNGSFTATSNPGGNETSTGGPTTSTTSDPTTSTTSDPTTTTTSDPTTTTTSDPTTTTTSDPTTTTTTSDPTTTTTSDPTTTTTSDPTTTTTTSDPTTTAGTTSGPGTVPAPASLSSVTVTTTASVLGAGSHYTVNLSGGSSGTFVISNGSVGSGTYTYAPSGNQARLVLTYTGEFQGDFDDMTLFFNAGPGTTESSTFTGTQKVGEQQGALAGNFAYAQ